MVAAGEKASFPLTVKNLGYKSDSFNLEQLDFEGADWTIDFYEADGTTPLVDNDTGIIEPGGEKEIVIKVDVPEDASIGEWARAEVRTESDNYEPPTPSPTPETPTPSPTPETPTPTPTKTPTPTPKWVRIWPDKGEGATYCIGDEIALCFEMSGPMHLRLWEITSEGQELVYEWDDDGTSWCLSGILEQPTGEHRFRLEAIENGQVVAWDETWVWVEDCDECYTHNFRGHVREVAYESAPEEYGFLVEVTEVIYDTQDFDIAVGDEVVVWAEEAALPSDIPEIDDLIQVTGHRSMVPCIPFAPSCDAVGIRVEVACDEAIWYPYLVSASGDSVKVPGRDESATEARSALDGATHSSLRTGEASALPRGHDEFQIEEPRSERREAIAVVARPSSQAGSGSDDTAIDVAVGTTFAQVYTDNESGDGTEDPENYFDPVLGGRQTPRRITTDEDESSYAAVATMPDGNAVNLWNTYYYNGTTWVDEINYAILDPSGGFVLPVTRLTDNSAASMATYDFSASADVATNGYVAVAWAQQQDTDGDLFYDRSSAKYAVMSRRGGLVRPPTSLTSNFGSYPRDYPPSVAALTSGRFLLAWERFASPSGPGDIYYAVLDNSGSIVRPMRRLTDGTGYNGTPRVAPLPDGQAAVVWVRYNEYGYREIVYAVVNSAGTVTKGPIQVTGNGNGGAEARRPDVVALSDGRLAVAWTRQTYGDQQIQYTIISGSEPPVPVTETPTPSPTPEPPTPSLTPEPPTPSPTPTTAAPGWITIASQDFEGAFPGDWSVHDNNGSDYGYYTWGRRSCRSYAGSYSGWAVGGGAQGSGLSCGSNYPNNAWSWMIHGPFSLADATDAELRFKMWLNTEEYYDGLLWCGSTDGSSFECDGRSGSTSGRWVDRSVDLSNLADINYLGKPDVWVALIFWSDTYVNEPEGAYVDDVLLRKCTSSTCQAEAGGETSVESLRPLEAPERVELVGRQVDGAAGAVDVDGLRPERMADPMRNTWVIHTVPNDLSGSNLFVSLTTDAYDNLIMTWLDSLSGQYMFYALANSQGDIRTPATILQRTRHSFLWSSQNGQGNDVLKPGVIPQKPFGVYLPALLKDRAFGPPVPPVINGGFESSEQGWVFGHSTSKAIRPAPRPVVVTSRVRSGSRAAVLGDENAQCEQELGVGGYRLSSWISQDIRVPKTDSPRLSFYYRMLTYDKWSADYFDRLEVYLDGTRIGNLGNLTSNYGCGNIINDLGWRKFSYDMTAYRGRTVRLKLVNVTYPDNTYSTWTYIDDVEVRP